MSCSIHKCLVAGIRGKEFGLLLSHADREKLTGMAQGTDV